MTQKLNEPIDPQGISPEALQLWKAIFDPKNAHLFTVEASLEAFKHIKVKDEDNEPN